MVMISMNESVKVLCAHLMEQVNVCKRIYVKSFNPFSLLFCGERERDKERERQRETVRERQSERDSQRETVSERQ
jgi:hypothetical protein